MLMSLQIAVCIATGQDKTVTEQEKAGRIAGGTQVIVIREEEKINFFSLLQQILGKEGTERQIPPNDSLSNRPQSRS